MAKRVYKSLDVNLAGDVSIPSTFGCSAIYVGTGGLIKAKLRGDAGTEDWQVVSGQYLLGDFESILSTANGTTASNLRVVSDV